MHGNKWSVLFGTLTYVLLHAAIVRAEEVHLLQAFGSAYEDYSRRIRWLPRRASWKQATRGLRCDFHSVWTGEYPVIGLTVIALAAAEFYEEIEKPLVGGQALFSHVPGNGDPQHRHHDRNYLDCQEEPVVAVTHGEHTGRIERNPCLENVSGTVFAGREERRSVRTTRRTSRSRQSL
ncbi:MAG: hypothetical protein WAV18_11995 [Roseiarcus sp.]